MELDIFLEKYLPDYEQKHDEFLKEGRLMCFVHHTNYDEDETAKVIVEHFFNCNYFPEALANYTDLICERQRKNCIEAYRDNTMLYFRGEYEDVILNAPQPKIDEL